MTQRANRRLSAPLGDAPLLRQVRPPDAPVLIEPLADHADQPLHLILA
jgi:hypothetical protein